MEIVHLLMYSVKKIQVFLLTEQLFPAKKLRSESEITKKKNNNNKELNKIRDLRHLIKMYRFV